MRKRWLSVLLLAILGGCSWLSGPQKYSVYFQPYSAELDQQARATIGSAAAFAHDHPLQAVHINGYAAPPDPQHDVDGLSGQRAETVKQLLLSDGIGIERITASANGIIDPKTLPDLAVRRVDIKIGGL